MEKNKWIIGLLIVLIILTYYIVEKGHIEGYDGQTSIVTKTNIQQPRGKNADRLYYFLFSMILIIIMTILYITLTIKKFTSLDDIYANLQSDPVLKGVVSIFISIIGLIQGLVEKLGWFLFVLFVIVILYSFISSIDYVTLIITFICISIIIGIITYMGSNKANVSINTNTDYPFNWLNSLILVMLLYMTFIQTGINEDWKLNFRVIGMFSFILLFYFFGSQYLYLLDFLRAGSLMTFGVIFIVFLSMIIHLFLEGQTKEDISNGIIMLVFFILYIVLFAIHFVYYHGFLYTKNISFLKWLPLPIMDSTKLKKNPLYIFCEGILFEPFYKIGPLKNRTVIENWHKKFSNILGFNFEIEDL